MKEINTNSKQFQNVLKKAIEKKPFVKCGKKIGAYFVRGSHGDFYPVNFQRASGGAMLGACLCAGAIRGFNCYHLAAALMVHSAYVKCGIRARAPARPRFADLQR